MPKAKVAALKVRPETILEDIERLCELAGMSSALDKGATTILKDNISWHYPFPGANTTPWQLEGTILALKNAGYQDVSCVQNKTVVTNAFKGEDLNHYVPLFRKYGIPVLYNFKDSDMQWVEYRPKAKLHVLHKIFPEGIRIPDYFFGKNIVHLPTTKCVSGDTVVIRADGSPCTIGEIVRGQLAAASNVSLESDGTVHAAGAAEMFAMAPDGAVQVFRATHFAKSARRGRRVLRMRTRTGRMLTATADHRIRTPAGWVELGALSIGSRIAMARRISAEGSAQPLPQTFSAREIEPVSGRSGRKYLAEDSERMIEAYRAGQTVPQIAAASGMRWQSVQFQLKRHGVEPRRNLKAIRVPQQTSPEFWRWLGYVMAEGSIENHTSTKLWWVDTEPAIRDEFVQLTHHLFGVEARPHKNGKHFYVYSRQLGLFLEELGLPIPLHAGNKLVPSSLFRCSNEEIAAFLSAYLDGDGGVSRKQADVRVTTKSERLARDVQLLLSRLGIASSVRIVKRRAQGWSENRQYHEVSVSGPSVIELARQLSLRHPAKAERLREHAARLESSKQPSNWDVVPVSSAAFRTIREGLGFTQASTGLPSSVNNIENGHTQPTPRIVRHFLALFEQAGASDRFPAEMAELSQAANPDLAWDEIEELADLEDDIDLYDITVPGADCFIGNGLVVHNCHIYTTTTGAMKNAFGGLLSTKRHYTHSWIHRTLVDLLAIQKEIHSGLFAIMDGTTAGNGPGPRTMFPVVKDYMLASDDQVAIDAVAAKMMGFDPLSLEFIKVAHDDGLGCGDPRDIEVVGADISGESWGFEVGDNAASHVGDVLWFGPLKRIQKLFFHTPLVNVFVFGSEAYHDWYRWPKKDRDVFEKWQRETEWGKLFQAYARGEADQVTRAASSVSASAE